MSMPIICYVEVGIVHGHLTHGCTGGAGPGLPAASYPLLRSLALPDPRRQSIIAYMYVYSMNDEGLVTRDYF